MVGKFDDFMILSFSRPIGHTAGHLISVNQQIQHVLSADNVRCALANFFANDNQTKVSFQIF